MDDKLSLQDDDDLRHWHNLVFEHKRHLRILEQKAAIHGRLDCPPVILKGIEDTQREISNLEQRIRRRIRHSEDNKLLYTGEEIEEIAAKMLEIQHITNYAHEL